MSTEGRSRDAEGNVPEEPRMEPARGIAGRVPSANDRFKQTFPLAVAGGLVAATLAHVAVFELFPTMRVPDLRVTTRTVSELYLSPDVDEPPPPPPAEEPPPRTEAAEPPETIAPTATPRVAPVVEPDRPVTIPRTTFDANPVPEPSPVPQLAVEEAPVQEPAEGPAYVPHDVPPELRNVREVQRHLRRAYPKSLREAGLGGRVVLWIFVDTGGRVRETRVNVASGYAPLDRAARKVALAMEFEPARNRDRKTAVWVRQTIEFEVAGREG